MTRPVILSSGATCQCRVCQLIPPTVNVVPPPPSTQSSAFLAMQPATWALTSLPLMPGLSLPVEEREDTIVGFKSAKLLPLTGEFCGVGVAGKYKTTAHAECLRSLTEHRSPDPDCTCGFYVIDTAEALYAVSAQYLGYLGSRTLTVTLTVDCWGTCVRHRDGWRVEHQRALRVTVPRCIGCDGPSTECTVAYDSTGCWLCASCLPGFLNVSPCSYGSGSRAIESTGLKVFSLADLADLYGTEFVSA